MLKVGDKIRILVDGLESAGVLEGELLTITSTHPIGIFAAKGDTSLDSWVFSYRHFGVGFEKCEEPTCSSLPLFNDFTELEHVGCQHELRDYVGLMETFKYCTKCDHKERA